MTFALYFCLKIRKERSPFVKYVLWERFGSDRVAWSREEVRADHRGGRPRPRGAEGHLPRPARPERRGQVDDDAAPHRPGACERGLDQGAWTRAARRLEGGARRDGRRAAARQPRRGRGGGGQPGGVRAALPRKGREGRRGPWARDVTPRWTPPRP